MKDHFFSVIVCAYNIQSFISECLDSILNQTYNNFEVIIIDDGSTDGTSGLCKEYEKKDGRIHYYFQANAGTTAARAKGFSLAKGDYVIAVDGDDTANPNWLFTINNCLLQKEYDCVFYNFYNWEGGKKTPSSMVFPKLGQVDSVEIIKNAIETRNHPLWDKAIKKEVALKANATAAALPRLSMNNDTIHIFYILANIKTAFTCNEYLINYRILPKSASHGYKLFNIKDALVSMEYAFDALSGDKENFLEYKRLLLITLLKTISFRLPKLYFSKYTKKEKKDEIDFIYKNAVYKESFRHEKMQNLNAREFIFLKIFRWHIPFLYYVLGAVNAALKGLGLKRA